MKMEERRVEEKGTDEKTEKVIISINKEFYRPAEVYTLLGDATKARERLGWVPKTPFTELVKMMVEADLEMLLK